MEAPVGGWKDPLGGGAGQGLGAGLRAGRQWWGGGEWPSARCILKEDSRDGPVIGYGGERRGGGSSRKGENPGKTEGQMES